MKKVISLFLSFVMLFSITAGVDLSVYAATSGDYEYYMLDNGTAEITGYTGSSTNLTIPSTIDGCTVTSIGAYAFSDCTGLASVTIPTSVTTIGPSAFQGTNLVNIVIPNSVKGIGECAFASCSNLSNISLSDSVINISPNAFYNTRYYNTDSNWEDDVLYINNHLIEARNTITGKYTIKSGTKSIACRAFFECTSLTSVTIPDSVTSIGELAFTACSGLTSVTMGNGVTSIGNYAFEYCTGLTSITIPDSVTGIGELAFNNCTSLTKVTIPKSVTSIGATSFDGCIALNSFKVDSNNKYYDSRNNCNALIETSTNTLIQGFSSTIIPNTVTSIGDNAFENCTSLTSITIPDSVTHIGHGAFEGCTGLVNATLGNGITNITNYAFYCCTSLTNITIPDSITSIDLRAFSKCTSLISVTIPGSVKSIGENAFDGCTALTSVTIDSGVEKIYSDAFYDCTNLMNITLPSSVKLIDSYAFANCREIANVFYNGSADEWVNITFSDFWSNPVCSKTNLFFNDELATNVVLSNGVTRIGDNAFGSCTSLTSITIPDSVTSIGDDAFEDCTGLTSVTIPDSVTSIGDDAFYGCNRLTKIAIPKSVTSIGSSVFEGRLYSLTIYYSGSEEQWNAISIGAFNTVLEEATIYYNTCLEHEYTSKITKQSTCETTGVKSYICSNCGDTYTETIAKKSHTLIATNTIATTCTTDGYIYYSCTLCGNSNNYYDIVEATGHSYKTTATKATLTKSGSKVTKCTTCGDVSSKSTIYYPKTIKLSYTTTTYNGNVRKPTVTVKDSKGNTISSSNYTVTYTSGRKNVGKYKVTIKFKGNYSGTKTLYFTIKPKATSISSLKAGDNRFTVKWKKQSTQCTGYQIQYSTSSKFTSSTTKTSTVSSYKTTSKTIKSLKNKKKYYVRVRTYKTVNGTKYYSSWSSVKSVKTK